MKFSIAKALGIFALLQLTSACTTFTPALSPEAKTETGAAYVYGRFILDHTTKDIGRLRLGLVLEESEKAHSYTIEFEPQDSPTAIAVKPGIYILKKLVFASWNYESEGEKNLPQGPLVMAFSVEPGKMYYLADFVGQSSVTSSGNRITHSWRLKSIKENYEGTTAEMKRIFPNFQQLEFERALKLE